MRRALGIDVGASKVLVTVVDDDGCILASTRRPTGRDTSCQRLLALVAACRAELGEAADGCVAAGVGFPGSCDLETGTVRSSIMLDGWRDETLGREVAGVLGLPTVVDNDVNMALVAELQARGAPRGCVVFVAIGTGIGGAVAFDAEVWRGANGVAGEIGNMSIDRHGPRCWCGRSGCLNVFASGDTLAASGADPQANQRAAAALGFGLGNVLHLLDPSLVVFGGGVAVAAADFVDQVARAATTDVFDEVRGCRFERALAGYEAGAVGAALLALRRGPVA